MIDFTLGKQQNPAGSSDRVKLLRDCLALRVWLTTLSFLEIDGDSFSGPRMSICAQNLSLMAFGWDGDWNTGILSVPDFVCKLVVDFEEIRC